MAEINSPIFQKLLVPLKKETCKATLALYNKDYCGRGEGEGWGSRCLPPEVLMDNDNSGFAFLLH